MVESRTIVDSLCDVVLLELFQYFYVDEIFKLFHDTIARVSLLLKEANMRLHVGHVDRHFRKHVLPYIDSNNVISIRIRNMYQMSPVNLSQFGRAHFLELHNVTIRNWPSQFPEQLKYLIIYVRSKHREEILEKAISLDNLNKVELHSTFLQFNDVVYDDRKLDKPSSIRHLTFSSQCCFINYQFLLNNMPCLQSLRSINTFYPHRQRPALGNFTHLHTIDLDCRYVDIAEMICFLTQIASGSLRQCRIVNTTNSLSSGFAELLIS